MNKHKRIEVTVDVRSLCRQENTETKGWLYAIVDIGSELFRDMDTDANVRERRMHTKDFRELCNVITVEENYVEHSTLISGYSEKETLALHPDSNTWVNALTLDDNTLKRVNKLRFVYNCFDGQHRGGAFQIALDELRSLVVEGQPQKRETRIAIVYGLPETERAHRAKIAGGHNTISQKVDKSTIINAKGDYEPVVAALGERASSVEWVQNAAVENPHMIYQPYEIFQIIMALSANDFTSQVQMKVKDWTKSPDRFLPWFPILPVALEAYEIIRYESEKVFIESFGSDGLWEDAKVKQMFDDRNGPKPRRKLVTTATLGDKTVYALNASLTLLILHAHRGLFGLEDGKARLLTTPEEFFTLIRADLAGLLEKIAHRKFTPPSQYIREKRKVGKRKVSAAGYALTKDVEATWDRLQEPKTTDTVAAPPTFQRPAPEMTM